MTAVAFPYFRPPADSVLASAWIISEDGVPVEVAAGCLAHFDYSGTLKATRRIQVNFDVFAESIAADPDQLKLTSLVFLGTGGARLDRRRGIFKRQLITREMPAASLDISIAGRWLSQSLNLTTELILAAPDVPTRPLAPKAGARLWRDDFRLGLDPAAPRFPIEVVSFAKMFPQTPPGAMWFLDWSLAELDHDFASSVRLFINEDSPDFVEKIRGADELTLRLLMNAVTVQMTRSALLGSSAELLETGHTSSSVGGVISEWIARSFPGQTIASVKALAEFDPARFEMSLASLAPGTEDDV